MQIHSIAPVYNADSRILILGSFPSVKSREVGFFYGHKQNRFWRVLSAVFESEEPKTVEEKREFLLRFGIALWDVIASCEITGSSDATIRNAKPNDVEQILKQADIRLLAVNGKTALRYYDRYLKQTLGREAIYLPSTSPANAAYSLAKLIEEWKVLRLPK